MPPPEPTGIIGNPYRAPQSDTPDSPGQEVTSKNDVERIRYESLSHESSIKGIGTLFLLTGALSFFAAVALLCLAFLLSTGRLPNRNPAVEPFPPEIPGWMSVPLFLLSAFHFWMGYGLRKLREKDRIKAGLVAIPGLLMFPVGTAISAYIIYVMFSKKGKWVCSPEFRTVIEATPHIQANTTILSHFFSLLLLTLNFLGVVFAGIWWEGLQI